jgi:hypothetical protein
MLGPLLFSAAKNKKTLDKICKLGAPSSLEPAACSPNACKSTVLYRSYSRFFPVALYSPALGGLMKSAIDATAEAGIPKKFADWAVQFVQRMNGCFPVESARKAELVDLFRELVAGTGITFNCVSLSDATTDGTFSIAVPGELSKTLSEFRLGNVDVKNEPGKGGDASLQNLGYYARWVKEVVHLGGSVVPMVGVTVAGNRLGFWGFVTAGGVVVSEPLTDDVITRCTPDGYIAVAKMAYALSNVLSALCQVLFAWGLVMCSRSYCPLFCAAFCEPREILFSCLSLCVRVRVLQERLAALQLTTAEQKAQAAFPVFGRTPGNGFTLVYHGYLCPDIDDFGVPKKPIFVARVTAIVGAPAWPPVGEKVVVKFVDTGRRPYGIGAHMV